MVGKVNRKASAVNKSTANKLNLVDDGKQTQERQIAAFALSPIVVNGSTARTFAKGGFGEIDLTATIAVMREKANKVHAGDLSEVEATLTAQATTLDAIFNELARRAALNMGQYINATETYLRLALKAQTQCRATLETLAAIKHPKSPTFVQQQNVAYQQQVNNGNDLTKEPHLAPARTKRTRNSKNELLETQHGKRLDSGTTRKAGSNDSHMAPVGAVNRAGQ